jgi:hypothetical protein
MQNLTRHLIDGNRLSGLTTLGNHHLPISSGLGNCTSLSERRFTSAASKASALQTLFFRLHHVRGNCALAARKSTETSALTS